MRSIVTAALFLGIGFQMGKVSNEEVGTALETATVTESTPTAIQSASSTASATDETADWKTYTNETYGFIIKYPSDYSTLEASTYSTNDGVYIKSPTSGGYEQLNTASVEAEATTLSLDDYLAKAGKDGSFTDAESITFLGQPAYEGLDQGMASAYGILVKKGGYIYHISLESGNKTTLAESRENLTTTGNQILSTFQFTK